MTTVDSFPVAAQEKQKSPESPDFYNQVARLESMALEGIDTPTGTESFQFRAGIEIEFALLNPENWRNAIAENEAQALARHQKNLEGFTNPDVKERSIKDFEAQTARSRRFQYGAIRNPEVIEGSLADTTELLDEFKGYAADFIMRLPAKDEAQKQKRAKWLAEIPEFGVREVINFLIYEEFSKPTLSDNVPPNNGSIEDLDSYSDSQGWLEFRFGTGTLQSGYYDNEGMCEVRMAPCPPSEAIRRKQIISDRLAEVASQFGVLVQSTSNSEHVNLSAYQKDDEGNFVPVIGHDEQRRARTLDITAGIAKSFQDGLWLHPEDMQWDHYFDPKYGSTKLTFSPSRKDVRIMDGRLELRTRFHQADQAINWLVAGTMIGLQQGHTSIAQEGLQVPEVSTVYRVHRTEAFDKHTDLQIQRAFENSEVVKQQDGGEEFELNSGYNMIRGESIAEALVGKQEDMYGCDIFNSLVFKCITVNADGTAFFNVERFSTIYKHLNDRNRIWIDKFAQGDWEALSATINKRLSTVRLEPTEVIAGDVPYRADSQQSAIDRISHSESGRLAFGDSLGIVASWLAAAVPAK